jgi:transcriptional regulator with XRE-family HTH domain
MPKRKRTVSPVQAHFGRRLATLRNDAGLSQRKLARLCDISQRMIAYYEQLEGLPPGHVLPSLASALGTSVDDLIGAQASESKPKRTRISPHVLRRVQAMEELPLKDKKELLGIIDTYIEKNRLAARAS